MADIAHHSSQDLPQDLLKKMQETADQLNLGPTGQFPEGEIRIAITHHNGKVLIDARRGEIYQKYDLFPFTDRADFGPECAINLDEGCEYLPRDIRWTRIDGVPNLIMDKQT